MMKPLNIAIAVLILVILGMAGYFLYQKSKSEKIDVPEYDPGIDEGPIQVVPDQVVQAYGQGADDQKKQDEARARAAMLTGGLSEIGRAFGIKPFG